MGRVVQLAMEEVLKDGRGTERKLKTGLVVAGIPLFNLLIWPNFKQRPGVFVASTVGISKPVSNVNCLPC